MHRKADRPMFYRKAKQTICPELAKWAKDK